MPKALRRNILRATIVALFTSGFVACDGSDSGEVITAQCDAPLTASNPDTNEVTISGQATFDWVPPVVEENGGAFRNTAGSLDYSAVKAEPIKGAKVELLNQSNEVLNTTSTDELGRYAVLSPMNTVVKVRVLSQVDEENYDYSVIDNTSGNSLYALAGSFVNSSRCDSSRDLHADSGWDDADERYSNTRSAAPFAILDAVYQSMEMLLDADAAVSLPPLLLHWSTNNIAASGDKAEGQILTTHYDGDDRIYVLGHENNDTDEYDRSVIQHEFAHFLEDNLWRSDNIGGSHSINDRLDVRLAFGEGFANAFSSMVSGSDVYTDSFSNRQERAALINMESGEFGEIGWYSERSVGEIVYDFFDSNDDGSDTLSLGFAPIYDVLSSPGYVGNTALASIYLLASEMKASLDDSAAQAIDDLLQSHNIVAENEYGDGETNDGGNSDNLPLYRQLDFGGTINVCSDSEQGEYSGIDVRRFIRFSVPGQQIVNITIERASGILSPDPDGKIYRTGSDAIVLDSVDSLSVERFSDFLAAGDYILEVYASLNADFSDSGGGRSCLDVTVEGL